ncbi:hypothetical protein CDEST_15396 [Colletotrichum destructivum]|uniref:Uncharacterized protein n=1 Tax=Colletotrichum destructivum TaxID=34406 RepID=A0AAX4J485_9PEZI|nr:hypothetical protein CDEST_15396 [Colletotrichum destructivum]
MWIVGTIALTLFKQLLLCSHYQYNQVSLVRALSYLKLIERNQTKITEDLIKAALSVSIKLMGHREETVEVTQAIFNCGNRTSTPGLPLEEIVWANEVYLLRALDYDLFLDDGWDQCLMYESLLDSSIVTNLCLYGMTQLDIDWTATAVVAASEAWCRSKPLSDTQSQDIGHARKNARLLFVQYRIQEAVVCQMLVAAMLFSHP